MTQASERKTVDSIDKHFQDLELDRACKDDSKLVQVTDSRI